MSSIDNAADKNLKTSPAPAKGNANSTGSSRSSASAAPRDAAEDIEALIIDPRYFSQLSQENVTVEAYLYRQTAQRFSDCMWVMQQVLFASFDTRLATFLLDEVSRTGSPRLVVTHDEIARHLGSAREVVSRMLKYFEREGLVALSRGAVEVLDRKRLLARASD